MWFGLAHFHNGYSVLMISPNLLDIWPVFFLILSRCGTLHFLIVIRTSGDGYSLLGCKKQPPRHRYLKFCFNFQFFYLLKNVTIFTFCKIYGFNKFIFPFSFLCWFWDRKNHDPDLLHCSFSQDPETGLPDRETADTRTFGYNLARQLVTPHILRRLTRAGIQNHVKTKARCYLGK